MIVPVTFYQARCNRCDANVTEECCEEYGAWGSRGDAIEHLGDCDDHGHFYLRDGSIVLCQDCTNLYWPHLEDEDWDALADQTPEALAALRNWLAGSAPS